MSRIARTYLTVLQICAPELAGEYGREIEFVFGQELAEALSAGRVRAVCTCLTALVDLVRVAAGTSCAAVALLALFSTATCFATELALARLHHTGPQTVPTFLTVVAVPSVVAAIVAWMASHRAAVRNTRLVTGIARQR